jgi:hypothetical protein
LDAPREVIHNEAFNVGRTAENYQIRDVAEIIRQVMPGTRVGFAAGSGPDTRSYRVDCSKLERTLPAAVPRWTVRGGAQQLAGAYRRSGMTGEAFTGSRYLRIKRVLELRDEGLLDDDLRWRRSPEPKGY